MRQLALYARAKIARTKTVSATSPQSPMSFHRAAFRPWVPEAPGRSVSRSTVTGSAGDRRDPVDRVGPWNRCAGLACHPVGASHALVRQAEEHLLELSCDVLVELD